MGLIPNAVIIGKNMGVKIKTAGVISIKIPTNNNSKLIIKSITILLSLKLKSPLLISCGIFSYDNAQDIHIDEPINNITIAVVAEESNNICGNFGKVISL